MFVMGDQNKMFGSLYDESDDRDAPIGSFKTLTNFVHSKTRSALQSRGGLIKDINNFSSDINQPNLSYFSGISGLSATKGLATIHRVLPGIKFRLKTYSGVDFTIVPCIIKYDANLQTAHAANYFYALKFYMYPGMKCLKGAYGGGVISDPSLSYSWFDCTPYFIDVSIPTANQITNTVAGINKVAIGSPVSSLPFFSGDLNPSKHIFKSNSITRGLDCTLYAEASFTTPSAHSAEGRSYSGIADFLIYDTGNGSDFLHFTRSGTYVYLDAVTTGVKIFRVFTGVGSLDYTSFMMDSSEVPIIDYEFLSNGNLVISIQSNYLNTCLELSYVNPKFFYDVNKGLITNGNSFSRIDKQYASGGIYDRRLCYGYNPSQAQYDGSQSGSHDIYTNAVSGSIAKSFSGSAPIDGELGWIQTVTWSGGSPADNAYNDKHYKLSNSLAGERYVGFLMSPLSMHERTRAFYYPDSTYPLCSSYMHSIKALYNSYVGFAEATGNGVTKPSDDTVFTNGNFIAVVCGKYGGYRVGMHKDDELLITTPATYVLGLPVLVPTTMSKALTAMLVVLSGDKSSLTAFNSSDAVNWKTVISKDFLDDDVRWDQILCFQDGSYNVIKKLPCWVVNFTIGKTYYETVDKGGNHLLQTGNPDYSRNTLAGQTKDDVILASYLATNEIGGADLRNEYEIGSECIVVARDRLWAINPRLLYMQNGNLKNTSLSGKYKERKNAILYSPISENGPTFHLFDFGSNTLQLSEVGELVAISKIGLPQGLSQAVETERNNLLVLFRGGYQYWNLTSNDPSTDPWTDVRYTDDCCVSRDSVVENNGFVFCVGNSGVYMFLGTQKVDLTKLGGAKITKTWSAISTAYKEKTIGVFYPNEKWYIAIVPDLNRAYVFHLQGIFDQSNEPDKVGISEFEFAPHIGTKIVSACYHEGYIYVFCNSSTLPILKYDPTVFGDYINDSITSGAIVKTMQPNYIVPDVRRTKLNNLQIDYITSDAVTVELYADTRTINTVTLVSGEKLVNVNPKYNQSSRALRYSMKATVSGNRQTMINLIDFSVAEVVQKRLTRRDV